MYNARRFSFGSIVYWTFKKKISSHNCVFLQFLDGWVIFAEYAKQREATQPSQQGAPYEYSS